MDINKRQLLWAGIILAGIVLAMVWLSKYVNAPEAALPSGAPGAATSTARETPSSPSAATSTSVGASVRPFPINPADRIVSWGFAGPYAADKALVAQANADVSRLSGLIGSGKYDDYDIYDGIANDYANLGNGAEAYRNYDRAIAIHPAKGLAYANLGHFFSLLGAYYTAADAYAKAVAVEPAMLEYHLERLTYLTAQFPDDTARITSALSDASKQFGDTAPVLAIEARWLTSVGRYADAIKAWQTVKTLSPGQDVAPVNAAIASLQAKLQAQQ